MASDSKSRGAGRFCWNSSSRPSPSSPAMLARATVKSTGSNACTATRVAGSEPEKMITPINPLSQPLVDRSMHVSPFNQAIPI